VFAAFELDRRHPELGLPSLDQQVSRWLPWADPLEAGAVRYGLTPYATWTRMQDAIDKHLERGALPAVTSYADVRLRGDRDALARVRALLAEHPDLPRATYADEELRELFVLLTTHDRLFVTLDPA
jgi:hypothetical protein